MLIAESIFLILFYIGKINQSFLWLRLLAVFPFHSNIIASLYFPIIMYKGNYIILPAENIFIIYFVREDPWQARALLHRIPSNGLVHMT